MVVAIPLRRPIVLTLFIADVLHAAENRKHLAARAAVAVLGANLAGEAFAFTESPVHDQPSQAGPVACPTPRRPDRGARHQSGRERRIQT